MLRCLGKELPSSAFPSPANQRHNGCELLAGNQVTLWSQAARSLRRGSASRSSELLLSPAVFGSLLQRPSPLLQTAAVHAAPSSATRLWAEYKASRIVKTRFISSTLRGQKWHPRFTFPSRNFRSWWAYSLSSFSLFHEGMDQHDSTGTALQAKRPLMSGVKMKSTHANDDNLLTPTDLASKLRQHQFYYWIHELLVVHRWPPRWWRFPFTSSCDCTGDSSLHGTHAGPLRISQREQIHPYLSVPSAPSEKSFSSHRSLRCHSSINPLVPCSSSSPQRISSRCS
jgi:hypothetical protein